MVLGTLVFWFQILLWFRERSLCGFISVLLDLSRLVVHCVVLQSVPCALEPACSAVVGEYFVSVSSGWFGCVCIAGVSVTHPGRRVHLQQ